MIISQTRKFPCVQPVWTAPFLPAPWGIRGEGGDWKSLKKKKKKKKNKKKEKKGGGGVIEKFMKQKEPKINSVD